MLNIRINKFWAVVDDQKSDIHTRFINKARKYYGRLHTLLHNLIQKCTPQLEQSHHVSAHYSGVTIPFWFFTHNACGDYDELHRLSKKVERNLSELILV